MKKIFLSIAAMVLLTTTSYAADPEIQITCEQNAAICDVIPDRNAPLFDEEEFPNYDLKPGDDFTRKIRVTNNREETCYFSITSATKTEDTQVSTGEYFSEELMMELSNGAETTGQITFADLFASVPIYVGSLAPSEIKDFDWRVMFDKNAGNEFQRALLKFDFDWTFQCGQEPGETILYIDKTNNKLGITQLPGASVLYTITVSTEEVPVYNVVVFDLPPGGFTYRGGSWTAHSNFRGDLKGGGTTTEPTYASPGKWNLGNMAAGETVTLTYIADISSSQQPGTYPDIAWTEGTAASDPSSTRVIGNEGTGFFVGTNAVVAEDESPNVEVEPHEKTIEVEEEVGEVLGASTLPATGAQNIWAIIVGSVLGLGLLSVLAGVKMGKNSKGLKTLVFIAVFGLLSFGFSSRALAAGLLIRLEEPESPNRLDSLDLNFVVLDVEGHPVTVKCYKKGPGDATFVQFGGDIAVPAGGDDDYCHVPASILNDDGTYQFYAVATANGDTSTSQTITIQHDSDRPGTPKDLEKEKVDSCNYEVKFKTADDGGDTTRVEVYRSKDKEFEANSSTRAKDITVGSNQQVTTTISRPECGKTYYVAVIAFDDAGNRSDVLVETLETKETITVTVKDKGTVFGEIIEAIEVPGGASAVGVGGDSDEEQGVTTIEDLGETGESTSGDVLGEGDIDQDVVWNFIKSNWLLLLALIAVIYGYVRKRRKENQKPKA